ncbi:oligosaccharide flippase family protein [Rathayibacter festucae]|uniref:Oligosaccharide flippase family protein n=1 Tax=Rathayibacter festucae TaxID=110937 RepID=A0ABX6H169_9MICO|nr:oligosaccharide flippase family protein [Rathayibacter festucae]QHC63417.1 oligosaccharide flippase family protein [Rathayibacter festucae]
MLKNILTTYAARFAGMIATVAILPIVTAGVGAAGFGLYSLTVSMGLLFQQDLGMTAATVKFVAESRARGNLERMRRVIATSEAFFAVLSVVAAALLALAFSLTAPTLSVPAEFGSQLGLLFALGTANVFFALLFAPVRQTLTGLGALNVVNGFLTLQALGRVVLAAGAMAMGLPLWVVSAIDVSAMLLGGIGMYVFQHVRFPEASTSLLRAEWSVFRDIFALSSQLLVLSLAGVVILQFGSIVAGVLLPLTAVAAYAAAQRVYSLVKEVTASLSSAVLPAVTERQVEGGSSANGRVYIGGTKYANTLMLLVFVPIMATGPQLIDVWSGGRLEGAGAAAQILVLSLLANNNHLLAIPVLTAQQNIRRFAVLHVIWAVTAVGSSFVLALMLGVAGIALAVCLPVVLLEYFYVRHTLHALGQPWRAFLTECLARPYGALAVPGIAVVLVGVHLPASLLEIGLLTGAWLVVALPLIYVLALTAGERSRIRRIIGRRRGR